MLMWELEEFISSQITAIHQWLNGLTNFSAKANLVSVPKIIILNTMSGRNKTVIYGMVSLVTSL